jgi:hypothetical protein
VSERVTQSVVEGIGFATAVAGLLATQCVVEVLGVPGTLRATQLVVEVLDHQSPLMDAAGAPILQIDGPMVRVDRGLVIQTAPPTGEHRHTRQVHEHRARVYRARVPVATGAQVEALRLALEQSRGGAMPVWVQVPFDDAAPARYRILNAGAVSELNVQRNPGGSLGVIELELEEV